MDRTRFQQQQQMNSGLTRYRSAPSSYFSTLMNSTSGDTGGMIGGGGDGGGYARDGFDQQAFGRLMASLDSQDLDSNRFAENQGNPRSNLSVKEESGGFEPLPEQKLKYSGEARESNSSGATTSAMDNSYGLMMNTGLPNSNLQRYNTSPAGFFAQMDIQNGYGGTSGMGSYGAGTDANVEASFSSPSRFKNQTFFSSARGPSSSGPPMAAISEIGDDGVKEETSPRNDENFISTFPVPSWDDSDILSDYFLSVSEEKQLSNPSDIQKSEDRSRPPALLSHHLSLPKSSVHISAITQDSVPCKVRAKRGCATHPRSIAERVRRTRISERMRKLQELVPNMDKQTNTADMLDLAVDYIKDLESQVKVLLEKRAKCTCSSK